MSSTEEIIHFVEKGYSLEDIAQITGYTEKEIRKSLEFMLDKLKEETENV